MAVVLAIVGMLALGGAWTSASADQGGVPNGGANQGGPYDPTDECGGTNQGNSPNCNGSRGNADDKNPPGQVDNEHDRGYECDDNKGVGDKGGNPAHTGCSTTTTIGGSGCETPPCTTGGGGGGGGGGTTTTTSVPEGEVLGETEEAPQADVLGVTQEKPGAAVAGELARTGSTSQALGFLGLALLAFGGSAILFTRREEQPVVA